jgi:hypothetical protein
LNTINTPCNSEEVPDTNFKRLLKAIQECPKTAKELAAKTPQEAGKGRKKAAK